MWFLAFKVKYEKYRFQFGAMNTIEVLQMDNLSNLRQKVLDLIYEEPDLNKGVDDVIAFVGKSFGISRVYIFENNDENTHSSNTFEWCAPGIEPQMNELQDMSFIEYDYQSMFDENGLFFSSDICALPPAVKELFENQGIKATLQYGIYDKGIFRGIVGFDDCLQSRPEWDSDGISLSTLIYISRLLSVCLLKERNLQKLVKLQNELEISLKQEQMLRQEAISASESKNRFLANVSHDMRTPLNGIIGFTHLALESTDLASKDDCLEKVSQSANFLLDLVNETLNLSKIETGKVELNPEPADSKMLFKSILDNIRPSADAKDIELLIDTNKARWTVVNIDVLRLQEIFSNLLSNAVKFTPNGGKIWISAECLSETNNILHERISIKDNGIGMSEKFVKEAFEPFTQENPQENKNYDGTGLGLSIVKRLVELMNGKIELYSSRDKGTEFVIYMDMPISDNEINVGTRQNKVIKDMTGFTILVCEDHPINAELIKRLLEKKNATVDIAVNGKQGLEKFINSKPHFYSAILMDIRMPIMDGITATKSIRNSAHIDAKNIPIIAMTANAYADDKQEAIEAGMNAHLPKPISPHDLYYLLQMYLYN